MGRCPKYLNVNDFDALASSLGITLTDNGVSAIGEICEYLAAHILREAKTGNLEPLEFDTIVETAQSLGITLEIDQETSIVRKAKL